MIQEKIQEKIKKKSNGKSATNTTTGNILKFLFENGVSARRQNVLPIPIHRNGVLAGFRSGGRSGLPDIMGHFHPRVYPPYGRGLCIEVKTGKDRLRPEQIGFLKESSDFGDVVMIVKDFNDFLEQWNKLNLKK